MIRQPDREQVNRLMVKTLHRPVSPVRHPGQSVCQPSYHVKRFMPRFHVAGPALANHPVTMDDNSAPACSSNRAGCNWAGGGWRSVRRVAHTACCKVSSLLPHRHGRRLG